MKLFGTRSPPFMSSDVIIFQAKWSKIKERAEGWESGKKSRLKRITVCDVGDYKSIQITKYNDKNAWGVEEQQKEIRPLLAHCRHLLSN